MGNTPQTDLHVTSPTGADFSVQVKGAQTRSGWYARENQSCRKPVYVLVYLERSSKKPDSNATRFFVLTSDEAQQQIVKVREDWLRNHPGKTWSFDGIPWKDAQVHENKWDKLPP
jgi:hypothetical protein